MTINIHNIPDNFIITKENVYSIFCSEYTGKLSSPLLQWRVIRKHPLLYVFLNNYYDDANAYNSTASEILYRITHDIETRPICPLCGKPVRFKRYRGGYKTFCDDCGKRPDIRKHIAKIIVENNIKKYGVSSPMKLDVNKKKVQNTCMKRYGTKTVSQVPEFRDKQRLTAKQNYSQNRESILLKRQMSSYEKYGTHHPSASDIVKQKMKDTCLKRYGVEYAAQSNYVKNKIKQTCIQKYNAYSFLSSYTFKALQQAGLMKYPNSTPLLDPAVQLKSKQSCLYKYDVEYSFQSANNKQKSRQTCVDKYGVPYPLQNSKIIQKVMQTKKNKGSINSSTVEKEFKQYLIKHNIMFYTQYKSVLYPYYCDFYFPVYDLYLEIQGTWTHGGHPFDIHDKDDITVLNRWKSKHTKYYDTAVRIWTERDIMKRRVAKDNSLNFIEVFSHSLLDVIQAFTTYINSSKTGYSCICSML